MKPLNTWSASAKELSAVRKGGGWRTQLGLRSTGWEGGWRESIKLGALNPNSACPRAFFSFVIDQNFQDAGAGGNIFNPKDPMGVRQPHS